MSAANIEEKSYSLISNVSNNIDADKVIATQAAVKHIRDQILKRGTGVGIKVGIKQVGCSGYMYVVDFIDRQNDDDYEFEIDKDISVFVDKESIKFLRGTKIDYVRKGLNENFEFDNPNSKSVCGCGESFTI